MKRSAELAKAQPLGTADDAKRLSAAAAGGSFTAAYAAIAATGSGAELLQRMTSDPAAAALFADSVAPAREAARDLRALARFYAEGADRIEIALRARNGK